MVMKVDPPDNRADVDSSGQGLLLRISGLEADTTHTHPKNAQEQSMQEGDFTSTVVDLLLSRFVTLS